MQYRKISRENVHCLPEKRRPYGGHHIYTFSSTTWVILGPRWNGRRFIVLDRFATIFTLVVVFFNNYRCIHTCIYLIKPTSLPGRAKALSFTLPTNLVVYEDAIGANCDATFQYHASKFQASGTKCKYHVGCAKYRHSRPPAQNVQDQTTCSIESYHKASDLAW